MKTRNHTWGWFSGIILLPLLLLSACSTGDNRDKNLPQTTTGPTGPAVTVAPVDETIVTSEAGFGETQDLPGLALGAKPLRLSRLLDYEVWNSSNTDLGRVGGVVINSSSGRVEYLVIAPVPSPEALKPVPWTAFEWVTEPSQGVIALQLPAGEPALSAAPVFNRDELAQVRHPEWDSQVAQYWVAYVDILPVTGAQDAALSEPLFLQRQPFQGIRYDVENFGEEDLGDVRELFLAPDGRVLFVVMQVDRHLSQNQRYVPVPWKALVWNDDRQRFFLDIAPDFLAAAPGYGDLESLAQMKSASLTREVNDFWANLNTGPAQPAGSATGTPLVVQTTPITSEQGLLPSTGAQPGVAADDILKPNDLETWLRGALVVGPQGEQLGQVEEFVYGPTDTLELVVVRTSMSGTEQWKLAPLRAFFWFENRQLLFLELDSKVLADAPAIPDPAGFDPSNPGWEEGVSDYWNGFVETMPDEAAASGEMPRQASLLLHRNVVTPAGEVLGVVDEVLPGTQGRRYLVFNAGDRLVMVPWQLVAYEPVTQQLVLDVSGERLQAAPGFASLSELNPAAEDWEAQVSAYWLP